ncbi:MAG: heavy metal-binding domain-containing protein [Chthoniobacterales bacterium]
MPNDFPFQKIRLLAAVSVLALGGCAVHLPPGPVSNPADPHAAEAGTAPLRPKLLATSRTFVSPQADDRVQKAKQMDMSKMKDGAMQHEMAGMSHQGHDMSGMQMQPAPAASPAPSVAASGKAYFTCPMHPEIHEAGPGQCPECGMTLVKKSGAPEGAKP